LSDGRKDDVAKSGNRAALLRVQMSVFLTQVKDECLQRLTRFGLCRSSEGAFNDVDGVDEMRKRRRLAPDAGNADNECS